MCFRRILVTGLQLTERMSRSVGQQILSGVGLKLTGNNGGTLVN